MTQLHAHRELLAIVEWLSLHTAENYISFVNDKPFGNFESSTWNVNRDDYMCIDIESNYSIVKRIFGAIIKWEQTHFTPASGVCSVRSCCVHWNALSFCCCYFSSSSSFHVLRMFISILIFNAIFGLIIFFVFLFAGCQNPNTLTVNYLFIYFFHLIPFKWSKIIFKRNGSI